MDVDDIDYLKSLPKEEAARTLHARGVALQMGRCQKMRLTSALATLLYGSDKVLDNFQRSLAETYLKAYLAQPENKRNAADSLTHVLHAEHNDAQTAAILMAHLDINRVTELAERLNFTPSQVQTALIVGIAELLDGGQLAMLGVLELSLFMGATATRHLRGTRN